MTYDYPQTRGGWEKSPANPLLGSAELGTCFDVHVKRTPSGYRMYFSWRPHLAIAVTESPDGIRWGDIRIVLPPDPTSGWEDKVNRNCVVEEEDGRVLMWYTGQARKRSLIGLAESSDGGASFRRFSREPVMIPPASIFLTRWWMAAPETPHSRAISR